MKHFFSLLFFLCTINTFGQFKVNEYGAIYGGSYTQMDLRNHFYKEVPGVYVYGSPAYDAIYSHPGIAGTGVHIEGEDYLECFLKMNATRVTYIISAQIDGLRKFCIDNEGNTYAKSFISKAISIPQVEEMNFRGGVQKNSTLALKKIQKLRCGTYLLNSRKSETIRKTKSNEGAVDDDALLPIINKKIGISVEELESVIPESVYRSKKGELAVDYNQVVSVLLQAVQELDAKVNLLEETISSLEANRFKEKRMTNIEVIANKSCLSQNSPNPFNNETEIQYHINKAYRNAYIGIFTLNGKLLKRFVLTESSGKVHVSASDFNEGMYIYSLIIDNKEIESKKMIINYDTK